MRLRNPRRPALGLQRLEDRLAPSFGAVGSEFRINTVTAGSQNTPRVASDADGDIVVVWNSNGQDGNGVGVFAQRFSSTGGTLGTEFRVNSFTSNSQFAPAVAMDAAGDFVVAWTSYLQDGAGYGVYAQRYNSAGAALGGEFQVATTTASDQGSPGVGMNAAGDFVIGWASPDGSAYGVFARRFTAAGAPLGGEFPVNTFTTNPQDSPAIAMDTAGNFVVAWRSSGQDGNTDGVFARRFSAAGAPLTGEFQVNQFTTGNQNAPAIAMDLGGDFAIAWQSAGQDGSGSGVYARRYGAAGAALANEFRVNTITANAQSTPAISMIADGAFAIAWQSSGQEGAGNYGIYAQRYSAAGTMLGGEIHVNSFTTGLQANSTIAADADGDFVVAWQSFNQDLSAEGIYAQRYADLDNDGDTVGPAVAAVTQSGGSAPIRPDARLDGLLTGFVVAFTEDMSVAGGASGATSATNPANYRLSRNGVDVGAFISGIVYGYNPGTNRFEAALTLGAPRGDGQYVLTLQNVLTDLTGNRLDGVSNGSGFANDFTVSFAIANAGVAAGAETRVNSTTTGSQLHPAIAMNAAGEYVATWDSINQDGDEYGVFAQRYSAAAIPQGPEFQVNTFTTQGQLDPSVGIDAAGNFVVVWTSQGNQDGSGFGIFGQRYSAAGLPLNIEFQVNQFATFNQFASSVAMAPAGDFVVTWVSNTNDGNNYGIFARRYNAAGAALGNEFQVNQFTTGAQTEPAIAMDAVGDFTIAWTSNGQDGGGDGVFARRFSATGVALGAEFRLNQTVAGDQSKPAMATDGAGKFVFAWQTSGQDGGGLGIFARIFDATGAAQGGEFRVNGTSANDQKAPAVAMDAAGDFVIVWDSLYQDGNSDGIFATRYSPASHGGEFRVNTFTTLFQKNAAVAMDAAGDSIITWDSYPQDGNSSGVYSQRYSRLATIEAARTFGGAVPIAPGGTLSSVVTTIVATVSGPLATSGAGSVTNVANWQLANNGAPVAGGVSGVTFGLNAGTNKFEAAVNVGFLFDGRYTLTALPSILDPDGRTLDGDANGLPGGPYTLSFDVKGYPPKGPETRVNTFTTNAQIDPAVAMNGAGDYVVAWTSYQQAGSTAGIYAQRYSAAGAALGAEFHVNTFATISPLSKQAVAIDAAGEFVIVWTSLNQDGSGFGIDAQRYSTAGAQLGSEFQVNLTIIFNQEQPSVAMDAAGDFVIAWASAQQDGNGYAVEFRRFNAAGTALSGEIQVNQFTTDFQFQPAIAMNALGDFAIAWTSRTQDGAGYGVYGRRFSATGSALGSEFQVNQFVTGDQRRPAIGMDAAGGFLIAFQTAGEDGNGEGIFARRYDGAGMPQSFEFRVNATSTGNQSNPAVAMNATGDFVIAWDSDGNLDGSGTGVFATQYNAVSHGGQFPVNSFTVLFQDQPAIGMDAAGDFVVAWQSLNQDGSSSGVYSQRYVADLTPTTTGLPNVSIPASPATPINLAAGFNDVEDGSAGLTYSLTGNTNAALFTSAVVGGSTLTLTPAGPAGSSLLTIRATDSSGLFVQTSFTVTVVAAPAVTAVQVNDGSAQRSRVTSLKVTFSAQVGFAGAVASAFTLTRNGGGAVAFAATAAVVGGATQVTLNNFTGGDTEFGSLRDGRYTLTVLAAQISNSGGPLNRGTNFNFGDAQGLFRFYGDMNGDRRVDISDFGFFSLAFLQAPNYNAALDFNNDGRIDIADFGQFSVRYFTSLP